MTNSFKIRSQVSTSIPHVPSALGLKQWIELEKHRKEQEQEFIKTLMLVIQIIKNMNQAQDLIISETIAVYLRELTPKETKILRWYYLKNKDIKKISKKMEMSQAEIETIIAQAINKLREVMQQYHHLN